MPSTRILNQFIKALLPPQASFFCFGEGDPATLEGATFDYLIIPRRALNEIEDVYEFLTSLRPYCDDRTRLIFLHNAFKSRFSLHDLSTFLQLSDYQIVTKGRTFRFLYVVARPLWFKEQPTTVSVIVPVRNERGNIEAIIQRTPELGTGTEIIFVEGGSNDGTREECERQIKAHPERNLRLVAQTKSGKGNAVREGFAAASHDVLVILDGDLAIPPEELKYLHEAFVAGKGEFMTSSRLTYPMWKGAMPILNQWANPIFAWFYSWLMGQWVKDLFGGTKLFRKSDYAKIDSLRSYFEINDGWGDLDFLFGAAKLGMKISDFPVHYHPRIYGDSNMKSLQFGFYLIKTFLVSLPKFKPVLRSRR